MLATQSSTIHLTRHDLSIKVKDRYANIEYAWTFQNNNNTPNTSHALKFDLTLDPNAFISSFYATMDGLQFNGSVKEKPSPSEESKVNGDNDTKMMVSIAQTHCDVPNVYTISAVVAAQTELSITLGVEQYVLKQLDCNRLDIEMLKNYGKYAIVPVMQYVSFEAHVADHLGVYEVQVPSTQLTSNIFIDSSQLAPSSLSAGVKGRILTQSSLNELSITYKSHNVPLTDDTADVSPKSVVLLDEEHGYFCHVVSGPAIQAQLQQHAPTAQWQYIPRRVVYMLDRSGSMLHVRWQKCLHALMGSVQQLRAGVDKFCILLFDANIEAYPNTEQMCQCSVESVQHALQWLQTKQVGNGTNINHVLLSGVQLIDKDVRRTQQQQQQTAADAAAADAHEQPSPRFMNQMVFITDGAPTAGEVDTSKIVSNVKHALQSVAADIQLFCFGVGINTNDASWTKELNHAFLRALCGHTHGFYKRIKQQYADKQLKRYLQCIARPFLCDVQLKYSSSSSHGNSDSDHPFALQAFTKTKFHAFHAGEDLVICGKLNLAKDGDEEEDDEEHASPQQQQQQFHLQNVDAELVATCMTQHGHETTPVHVTVKSVILALQAKHENTIQRIGAYLLLHQCSHKVLSATQQRDALQLALKYGFVTPWTCMAINDRLDHALASPPPSSAAASATALAAMAASQTQAVAAAVGGPAMTNSRNQNLNNPTQFQSSMEQDLTPEFRQKVYEIERRIVQHLHQRGYDESHPDYHRYIAKAKELALQKAQKHRMARQQQLMEQMTKNGAGLGPGGPGGAHYESVNDGNGPLANNNNGIDTSNGHHTLTQNKTPNDTALTASSPSSKSPKKGLIVLRGLPGSGKTSLARKITKRFPTNSIICTEDRYHWSGKEDGIGVYKFQPEIVFQARELCNKEIRRAVDDNVHLIVVDNHNARISMYEEHIKYAVQKGYRFRIIEFLANYQLIEKYRKRSLKQFPKTIYSKLLKLWEVDPRAEIINPVFAEDAAAVGGNATELPIGGAAMDGMDAKHTVNGYHSVGGSGGMPTTDGYDNRHVHDSMLSAENLKMNDDATQFPLKYEVMLQARVRTAYDLKSEHITDLPEGTIVTIEEFVHNRAKISAPCRGWISGKSQYGERIVMPKTKEFSRIGGKVLFKRPIYGQPMMDDGRYPMSGVLVDYDEKRRLYQVKYVDGNIQWIDLRDPNIMFMKSGADVGGGPEGNLNAGATEFRMQTTESFFNQFFCKDYPQYAAQSTSTVERMDIKLH